MEIGAAIFYFSQQQNILTWHYCIWTKVNVMKFYTKLLYAFVWIIHWSRNISLGSKKLDALLKKKSWFKISTVLCEFVIILWWNAAFEEVTWCPHQIFLFSRKLKKQELFTFSAKETKCTVLSPLLRISCDNLSARGFRRIWFGRNLFIHFLLQKSLSLIGN